MIMLSNETYEQMIARQQMIYNLAHCSDADADRINNRLQQCNVRVVRDDNSAEQNTTIRTRQQLICTLQNDDSIKCVQYSFNGQWTTAQATLVN